MIEFQLPSRKFQKNIGISICLLRTTKETKHACLDYVRTRPRRGNTLMRRGKTLTIKDVQKNFDHGKHGFSCKIIATWIKEEGYELRGNTAFPSKLKIYLTKQTYYKLTKHSKSAKISPMKLVDIDEKELITKETVGVKYLGSKRLILPYIGYLTKALGVNTAIDVFTGTTRVAQYLRQIGIRTFTSDLNEASECYANTFVHNQSNGHLQKYVNKMNELSPKRGWLTKNYSGKDVDAKREDGRCWQAKNTMRADAARDYVADLLKKEEIEKWEADTLITSIILALDKVDNTVGVQQAYLKEWCARSKNDIKFQLPPCISGPVANHFCDDALKIKYLPADMAYLDPPYSPHSYATYYHIWDSIALWDKPETDLTARRRIDRVARTSQGKNEKYDMEKVVSKWNLRNEAMKAFQDLIKRLPTRYIMISYNDESIVKRDKLMEICDEMDINKEARGVEVIYRRNIMSQIGNAAKDVTAETPDEEKPKKNQKNKELIIIVDKGPNANIKS